jgi:hypothetical protein
VGYLSHSKTVYINIEQFVTFTAAFDNQTFAFGPDLAEIRAKDEATTRRPEKKQVKMKKGVKRKLHGLTV